MSGAFVTKYYRIVFEEYDIKPSDEKQDNIILEGALSAPSNCLDFGIRHEEQMEWKCNIKSASIER